MKLSYAFTDEDLEQYIKTDFNNKKNKILSKLLMFVLIFITVFISLAFLFTKDLSFLILSIILLILTYFLSNKTKFLKKKYINKIKTDGEKTVEITDTHLILTSLTRSSSFTLDEIKEVNLINNYFIFIKFSLDDTFVIPKSAFSTDVEMINFINLIKTNAKIL